MPVVLTPIGAPHMNGNPVNAVISGHDDPRVGAEPAYGVHMQFADHQVLNRHPVNEVLFRDSVGAGHLPMTAMPPRDDDVDNAGPQRAGVQRWRRYRR
jgi:hypothetical protein